ncbi:putative Six-hairpin glycosidase [Rosellinia necatrix]|uniref:Putative Six-hairpin glycosidase n=1 Tax=Rosellinia necatrix TaxID=77044 RepID=A0A1W2TSY7_ROSNE|nr:putative Six-hairpin glycosidase [Rosellinia necatrix]
MTSSISVKKALAAVVTFLGTSTVAHPQIKQSTGIRSNHELVQPIYQALPLGSVKPQGWLKDQLEKSASGLAGNLFNFYRFVKDSKWLGGNSEYSDLHESAPYWFNGLVPLAFGLDDPALKGQVKTFLDYILANQQEDGWLGPETTPQTRGLWGRCYIMNGLMQYAQADPSETDRIVDAMYRYIKVTHSMLQNNFTGLIPREGDVFDGSGWGAARAHEMHIPLQWLYENHPKNNSELLWETMELMIQGNAEFGLDWRNFFVEGTFPGVVYAPREQSYPWLFTHAVNLAEAIRFPLAIYRTSHDEALKTQTRTAVDLVAKYHKSIAGSIIGDEAITDNNPSRGSELCTSTELMFSLSWVYQYLADNDIADWAELTAFNAFPGQIWPDWWSHQYVQQENQPWSRNLTEHPQMWDVVGSYGNVFGLEPDYPCCAVNHPQGYPKFLANSFVGTEDEGIAHVFLSPGSVSTKLGNNAVTISVDTNYPFGMDLSYSISADDAFAFYVRIPSWANPSSTVTGPSSDASVKITPADSGLQKFDVPGGQSKISVNLQTEPRVVELANNTAAVYYGQLLYSLALNFNETTRDPVTYDGGSLVDSSSTTPQTRDHIVETTDLWNIAIDPSQIKVVTSDTSKLANPVWAFGAPPVELRIAATEIDWPIAWDSPADPPLNPQAKGKPFNARFVPFASAKVHMAHLPKVKLDPVDLDTE